MLLRDRGSRLEKRSGRWRSLLVAAALTLGLATAGATAAPRASADGPYAPAVSVSATTSLNDQFAYGMPYGMGYGYGGYGYGGYGFNVGLRYAPLPGAGVMTSTLYANGSLYVQVQGRYCTDKTGGQIYVPAGSPALEGVTCGAGAASTMSTMGTTGG